MVERLNKATRQMVVSPERTFLFNPGNNQIIINRLTTIAAINPVVTTTTPPVQQQRGVAVRIRQAITGRR